MGFMAAAIPIATTLLSSMSKQNEQPQQAPMAPPPTLGQIFAQNWQNNNMQNPFPGPGKY